MKTVPLGAAGSFLRFQIRDYRSGDPLEVVPAAHTADPDRGTREACRRDFRPNTLWH
jgi:hypothetical protein